MQGIFPEFQKLRMKLVLLGASNLTLGLSEVVHLAHELWDGPIQVYTALGYGRSYGMTSRFIGRALPGILQSDLWNQLHSNPSLPMRAFMTDIGNDIFYSASVCQTLDWVAECLQRLQKLGAEVTLTNLPLVNIGKLSRRGFIFYRAILLPSCRLSFEKICERAVSLANGLQVLANQAGVALITPRIEWYGLDPIHIRPSQWERAWQEILSGKNKSLDQNRRPRVDALQWFRLYCARPQRQRIWGIERIRSQPVFRDSKSEIWMY
jgi:hypothetical protein